MDKPLLREYEAAITEEHLELRELIGEIRGMRDPHVLLPLLLELQGAMARHFDREEGDEGLGVIAAKGVPRHADRVEELLAEHRDFNAQLAAVIHECREAIAGPLARIHRDLDRFAAGFEDHDLAETEILTDALLEDAGPGAGTDSP